MTRQDVYKQERKAIEEYLGYAISITEVPEVLKTVTKVIQVINNSDFGLTYKEARLILRLADKTLREISGGIE